MSIAQRVTDNPVAIPRPSITAPFTRIDTFDKALTAPGGFGPRLRACRTAALNFRSEFAATGRPDSVRTHDLISLPYPPGTDCSALRSAPPRSSRSATGC